MVFRISALKIFAIFTGKHLCWCLFLIKLQDIRPTNLLKKDSSTSVFLWILRNVYKQLFYRTSLVAASKADRAEWPLKTLKSVVALAFLIWFYITYVIGFIFHICFCQHGQEKQIWLNGYTQLSYTRNTFRTRNQGYQNMNYDTTKCVNMLLFAATSPHFPGRTVICI